jgi:hypothetical protein
MIIYHEGGQEYIYEHTYMCLEMYFSMFTYIHVYKLFFFPHSEFRWTLMNVGSLGSCPFGSR